MPMKSPINSGMLMAQWNFKAPKNAHLWHLSRHFMMSRLVLSYLWPSQLIGEPKATRTV